MKIDFYILDQATAQKSLFFACQLIEKAYSLQQKVYIHTSSKEEAERFDQLLWTFRDNSFLPHNLYQPTDEHPPAIQIGYHETPPSHADLLINLTHAIPAFYQQFKHTIEIVFSDAHVQQLARERYKQYRDQGCELNTFKIKANEYDSDRQNL